MGRAGPGRRGDGVRRPSRRDRGARRAPRAVRRDRRDARAHAVRRPSCSSGSRACACWSRPGWSTRRSTSRPRRRAASWCAGRAASPSPTAELTWALILSLLRHVPDEDAPCAPAAGRRPSAPRSGQALGVVGLGRLGQRVAAGRPARSRWRCSPGARTWTRSGRGPLGSSPSPQAALLGRADVVTIHLRLSDRTRGLIGAAELARMKPSAVLVNTSRGPIVDETALVDALRDGTIAGAGLDVFDTEPLPPDHPLRTAPATRCSPRTSATSPPGPTSASTAMPSRPSPRSCAANRCACSRRSAPSRPSTTGQACAGPS